MLLQFTEKGIYCEQGGFYIDPWRNVARAIITHAHADHSRRGHAFYLAHEQSEEIMRLRLGNDIRLQTLKYGETIFLNGVEVSLHPAGHIIGSAQVRVAYKGEVWVVSGDYKLEADGICSPFEPIKCHHFVTESTFGMPVFRWQPQATIFAEINDWWLRNSREGKASVLVGYALGKAQRLLSGLEGSIGPVYAHGAIRTVQEALEKHWQPAFPLLKPPRKTSKDMYAGALVVVPPSAVGTTWLRRFQPHSVGFASGWMHIRGQKRRRAADQGFVISDHADWPALLQAIAATEATNVWVTHGYTDAFSRYLCELGYNAQPVTTAFLGEDTAELEEENTPAELADEG